MNHPQPSTKNPQPRKVRTLPQFLWRQRRAKRFRKGGLELDAFVAAQADHKARLCAAAVGVQALLGCGLATVSHGRAWIQYEPAVREPVAARLHELFGQQKLQRVHSATGALCFGPTWARVRFGGVLVEIMEAKAEIGKAES